MRSHGGRGRRGVRGIGVRGSGVRGRGGRAGVQQRCASASAGRGAVCGSSSVQNGRRAAAPHRWSAHAFLLVLRAMKERGMWLSGCALRGGDVAGVSRICAAMPRAGEPSQLLARSDMLAQQPRAARRAAQQG